MKIGLISDIHGNYEALQAVLAELDGMGVSEIYCLGDVVGYYSQVNECCDELRSRRIISVMGNHDWYMAGGSSCARSRSVNDCLVYQRRIITAENLRWLSCFPVHIRTDRLHLLHGGWSDPIDEYVQPTEEYFSRLNGEFFVSGHTHKQIVRTYSGKTYCNPGSVGQPRDNDPKAAFALYDGQFTLHRVAYDVRKVFDHMRRAGFNDYYYGCLMTGAERLCRP